MKKPLIENISSVFIYTSEDLKSGTVIRFYLNGDNQYVDIKIGKYEIDYIPERLGKTIKIKLFNS